MPSSFGSSNPLSYAKEHWHAVTTCSNVAEHLLRTNTSPKVIIIDGAGVAKETEALLAIHYNLIVFNNEI